MLTMSTNDTSKLQFVSTTLPDALTRKPTPMPSCPKSRACSQKNCLLPGPAAVFRQRVARAEYESVGDPATLISEQRIADVWNQYGREIGAPGETIITVAAIHNMRDGVYTVAQPMRVRGIRPSGRCQTCTRSDLMARLPMHAEPSKRCV